MLLDDDEGFGGEVTEDYHEDPRDYRKETGKKGKNTWKQMRHKLNRPGKRVNDEQDSDSKRKG